MTLKDVMLMPSERQNAKGGMPSRTWGAVVVDPASRLARLRRQSASAFLSTHVPRS